MRLIDADRLGITIDKIRPFKDETWYSFYQKVLNCINKSPTVEPKQGKWIFRPYADYNPTMGDIVCSKCDIVYFEGVPESRMKGKLYNFCPNCGADMRVKDELNRVKNELNSEIEKSKSEIVPDYRDGWRMKGDEK